MTNDGPLTSDTTVSGYTTDWTWGYNYHVSYETWRCMVFGTTPDDTPAGTNGHWNRKMRPIRFSVVEEGSLIDSYREISESAAAFSGSAILNNPTFYPPPASNLGPPLDGHFVGSATSTFSVSVPFGTYNVGSTARYIRLLVDGVDVTGPVSISVSSTLNEVSVAYKNFTQSGVTVLPAIDVTDKTVEVDIWIEVDITLAAGDSGAVGSSYYPAAWAFNGTIGGRYAGQTQHYLHFIRGINGIDTNALYAAWLDYDFTFSTAISGSETSATTVTASPWTVTRDQKQATLAHSNGTDKVILYYGQEIVEIILIQYQTHTPFNPLLWHYRYVPADTGHYALDDTVQPGIFTPTTLQTFTLIGSSTDAVTYNTNTTGLPGTWCPATITVGPYP